MGKLHPKRKYHRLRDYDYASAGLYFITFCTYRRKCFLSQIGEGTEVKLGVAGAMVEEELLITEEKRPEVEIIDHCIMPNHLHVVLQLSGEHSTGQRNEFKKPLSGTINTIIGFIKSRVTTRLRERYGNPDLKVWHSKFHDHVIRSEGKLRIIQQYVRDNPGQWMNDKYHPDRMVEERLRRAARKSNRK